jgi:hypothetical protein
VERVKEVGKESGRGVQRESGSRVKGEGKESEKRE